MKRDNFRDCWNSYIFVPKVLSITLNTNYCYAGEAAKEWPLYRRAVTVKMCYLGRSISTWYYNLALGSMKKLKNPHHTDMFCYEWKSTWVKVGATKSKKIKVPPDIRPPNAASWYWLTLRTHFEGNICCNKELFRDLFLVNAGLHHHRKQKRDLNAVEKAPTNLERNDMVSSITRLETYYLLRTISR